MSEYREYVAWDAPTRIFHWVNALAVIGLLVTGLDILLNDVFHHSAAGKVMLKDVHVSFGYVMVVDLLWRFVWAFFGNRHARWRAILPGGPGYLRALRAYTASFLTGEPEQYVGHNPLARIAVVVLFVLLLMQAVTGLVLAGTDLYWPPFGYWFASWVAAPGVDPTLVVPGATELIDKGSYDAMRAFRSPFIAVHEFGFYALAAVIVLHIIAVVVTEVREGGSITSAMFTGRKILSKRPPDAP